MTSVSVDPTAREVWRAAKGPVVVAAAVLLGGLVLAALAGDPGSTRLDPRAPNPSGSRALAQVLEDQGVAIDLATTTDDVTVAAQSGDTVLVVDPGLLVPEQVSAVRATGADLVVVAPPQPELFAPVVTVDDLTEPEVRTPGCRLTAARRAGAADVGGFGWDVAPGADATLCYASGGVPSLVQVDEGDRVVTLLGSGAALTNGRLDDEGNAALAMGLLGGSAELVWYLPSLADVPESARQESFYGLVPVGVWWGLAQIGVAVLLLALWRARRLGPVVTEPLPVAVRAAETVEGRARLYRRGGARDTAAEVLRAATRSRLTPALGLPAGAEPTAVVDAVASRAGRDRSAVGALLYGAAPADDAALVRLADELDALEREARRP